MAPSPYSLFIVNGGLGHFWVCFLCFPGLEELLSIVMIPRICLSTQTDACVSLDERHQMLYLAFYIGGGVDLA